MRELRERDPATYEGIDRNNPRRVIRAIEVIRLTGKPFSAQKAAWGANNDTQPFWILNRPTEELKARINRRVEAMFERGLVKETEQLLEGGLQTNPTAMQALGYRQVVEHLRGERGLSETIELVKTRTRQFAKRQLTWFRKQRGAKWYEMGAQESAGEVAEKLSQDSQITLLARI